MTEKKKKEKKRTKKKEFYNFFSLTIDYSANKPD